METRKITGRGGIYDKSLVKPKGEVSLSAFAFLFSEIVQYNQNRVDSIADLERKLEEAGHGIGLRIIELVGSREKLTKRETRIVNMLQFISNRIWLHLFNKPADALEKSMENEDEYMLHENSPITNTFVSVPADTGQLNCASFLAGILMGVLDSCRFVSTNARVTAHLVSSSEGEGGGGGGGGGGRGGGGGGGAVVTDRTVFLIKFSADVMNRERRLGPM